MTVHFRELDILMETKRWVQVVADGIIGRGTDWTHSHTHSHTHTPRHQWVSGAWARHLTGLFPNFCRSLPSDGPGRKKAMRLCLRCKVKKKKKKIYRYPDDRPPTQPICCLFIHPALITGTRCVRTSLANN